MKLYDNFIKKAFRNITPNYKISHASYVNVAKIYQILVTILLWHLNRQFVIT